MLENCFSLLALGFIVLAAYGVGRPMWRLVRLETVPSTHTAVWSIGLGLVCAALLWTALGMVGWLYRPVIAGVTWIAGCWAIVELAYAWLLAGGNRPTVLTALIAEPSPDRPPKWIVAGLSILAGVALVASLLGALAPPTAGDALCYHLNLPKVFLTDHALVFLPDDENCTFPLLVEMLYLWGLALDGPVAAQLIHWGLGLLLACATILLAESIVGRGWSLLAGAVVLLVPGVTNQMTAPLNDVGLAAFTTLALAAWWRTVMDQQSPRWLIVAGVFLGAAWGTKYLALLFTLAVGLTWLVAHLHQRRPLRAWLRSVGTVVLFATLAGGVWYARAAVFRGNPVFPFFGEIVGYPDIATVRASKTPLNVTPLEVARSPWTVTMRPGDFGGRGHQLGALFLLLLPGLCLVRRLRGVRTLLAIAFLHCAGWYVLRQNVRFLFVLLPLLAIPSVWVLMEVRRAVPVPRYVVCGGCALLLLFGAALPVYRARRTVAVALGAETRAEYLRRTEPTYAAAEFANRVCPMDAHVLSQDHRGFYFHTQFTRENLFRRRTGYDALAARPGDLCDLLQNAGFSHLLLAETRGTSAAGYEPALSNLVDRELHRSGDARLATRLQYDFTDSDGVTRRYRLMEVLSLGPEAPATTRPRRLR